jgi:hypothetical protein
MLFFIKVLDVHHHQVDKGQQFLNIFPAAVCAGLNGGMDASALAFCQDGTAELALQQWLSTRERHPPTRCIIKCPVAQHFFDHLGDAEFLSGELDCLRTTGRDALAAARTLRAVVGVQVAVDLVGLLLANDQAFPAQDAQFREKLYLGLALITFRVVAPKAAQWTPAQEDRGADSGAIMDRKTLNIENETSKIMHHRILP